MRCDYAVTVEEVKNNNMGWCVFDFVKEYLKSVGFDRKGGWYAYKLIDGVYYFKCAESGDLPSLKYRQALKRDGYNIAEAYLQ